MTNWQEAGLGYNTRRTRRKTKKLKRVVGKQAVVTSSTREALDRGALLTPAIRSAGIRGGKNQWFFKLEICFFVFCFCFYGFFGF